MSRISKVMDEGLVATLHQPLGDSRHPAVIVLSGSEGGIGNANLFGEPLAASGFVALCLAYFAMDGLPRHFSQIPLEYFGTAIEWLRRHPAVDPDRVAVFGMSRGGEAALLVGATFPAIRAVVANVPSHLVWQGTHPDPSIKTSSWTHAQADPRAAVSHRAGREPMAGRELLSASLDAVRNSSTATRRDVGGKPPRANRRVAEDDQVSAGLRLRPPYGLHDRVA